MEIFITKSDNIICQDRAYIVATPDIVKLYQVDSRGYYVSDMKGITMTEGKYSVNKKQFFETIEVMGKNMTIEAGEDKLIFNSDEGVEVILKTLEWNMPEFEPIEGNLKDIPENFMALIKKAAKMTSKDKNRGALQSIKILNDKVYATDSFSAFKGVLNADLEIEALVYSDILSVVQNPTKIALTSNNNVILESTRGFAVLKTIEDQFPVTAIESLIKPQPKEGNILGAGSIGQIKDIIAKAKKIGHKEFVISKDCTVYGATVDQPEIKASVNITIPNTAKWDIFMLDGVLISDNAYCKGGTEPMTVYGFDKTLMILPKR